MLTQLYVAGAYELNAMIVATIVLYGGFGQCVSALLEWKRGDIFGLTLGFIYGLY